MNQKDYIDLSQREAVIVAYGRSPIGKAPKGVFHSTHPVDLGAQTLKGVLARVPQLDSAQIDDVVVGCAYPEERQGWQFSRVIVQRAGLPDSVCAQTLTRFCSSGLQAIATGANAILAGQADVIVAGGVESMSQVKKMAYPEEYWESYLAEHYPEAYMGPGLTAENVAERWKVSRADMDAMAVESHRRADQAQQAGLFDEEIIPVYANTDDGDRVLVTRDEGVRPGTNAEKLAQLKPCFVENGSVTAATSSQMSDGAAFVVLMSRQKAEALGVKPLARLVGFAVGGCPAEVMGIGPIYAVPKVLERTGLALEDMEVIELNEAFASQALVCIRELGMDPERVNPNGGALALGHPLGATGAALTCKVLSQLRRNGGRYGMVTMCIGGGMGAAGIFELLNDTI
ncbi:MAG: thiolase family protein [Oscillospiraceae bacterium]|nr:thiolase family protein [Eubacteriales bacterium]MDY2617267.1 thiolase family protein [Oscillospiraceae bacterium]